MGCWVFGGDCELTLLLLYESALALLLLDDPLAILQVKTTSGLRLLDDGAALDLAVTVDRIWDVRDAWYLRSRGNLCVLVQIYRGGAIERLVMRGIAEVACMHHLDRHGDVGRSEGLSPRYDSTTALFLDN
jgi:hypothetical protein